MKKCLRFTKELTQKTCSHFPYFSYLNLKYVQCVIFFILFMSEFYLFTSQKS